jgi:SAM-dependent methyltransferase
MISKWPKTFPPLTSEQEEISSDFMKYWHEVLPAKYGIVDEFNHNYVVRSAPKHFRRTLEIGAGTGEHLKYENLTADQERNYVAVDIRENMVRALSQQHPNIKTIVGDCQKPLDYPDGYFDRILAIHVLEHLPSLPDAVRQIRRLCDTKDGHLSIVIPCEGSIAYGMARRISAQRIFEARYKQPYRWFIEREHINKPSEIFEELRPHFDLRTSRYFPIPVSLEFCNLCIGATLTPN